MHCIDFYSLFYASSLSFLYDIYVLAEAGEFENSEA
jgi:hypothetical protein